jgi:carbon-monoxide dehydrogenase iron sulfur subunit
MQQKTFFIRAEACTGCNICQLTCALVKEKVANPALARINIERVVMDGLMVPHICLNCKHPECIDACRRKAIVKDAATGWVTIDRERCNNCGLCVAACPFSAIIVAPDSQVLLCDVCSGDPQCVAMCPTGAIQFADRDRGVAGATDNAAQNIFK